MKWTEQEFLAQRVEFVDSLMEVIQEENKQQ